jgi:hypothetical protein
MDKDVQAFMDAAFLSGLTMDEIKRRMLKNGWSEKQVSGVMKEYKPPMDRRPFSAKGPVEIPVPKPPKPSAKQYAPIAAVVLLLVAGSFLFTGTDEATGNYVVEPPDPSPLFKGPIFMLLAGIGLFVLLLAVFSFLIYRYSA